MQGGFAKNADYKSWVALEDSIKWKSELFYKLKQEHGHLTVEAEEKMKKRDELANLHNLKSLETKQTEEILNKELSELRVKIEDTMLAWKRE